MPDIFVSQPPPTSPVSSPADIPINTVENPKSKFSYLGKLFSSYMFMPDGVRFETQEPGETIMLLLRKHWLTNIGWVLISVVLLFLPFILLPMLKLSGTLPETTPASWISLFILAWYLLTFSYFLVNFLLWYFTVSIVTNERIVDIDFINLLNKKFAETRVARVEDVTMRTGGFIRSFFDYGDVFVQTAAKEAVFQFLAVPHPEKVVMVINKIMGVEEEEGEVH
ncbi:hypothetical protein M1271_01935 [Patescibacteria group bacterium]|nr:hypothetical protein [Patescibacteria group bacterium]MCL5798306.1 hypothetical protein [Patescibacteria group bacterium]